MSDFAPMEHHILAKLRAMPRLSAVRIVPAPTPEDWSEGIVYKELSASPDTGNTGCDRIQATATFLVVADRALESIQGLNSWATDIDGALHQTAGSYDDGDVYSCLRTQPFKFAYVGEDGKKRQQLGAIFRITAKASTKYYTLNDNPIPV